MLAKLEKVQTPRTLTDGPTLVQQTVIDEGAIRPRPEILSTNCLRIRDIPSEVLRCTFQEDLTTAQKETLRERWAFRTLSDNTAIAFGALPSEAMGSHCLERVDRQRWRDADEVFGIKARDAVVSLVHMSIDLHLRSTGFVRDPYGWHVPHEFRPKSKLWFQKIDGGRTWVKGNGQRFFGRGQARRPYRYYLGANIRVLRSDSLEDLSLINGEAPRASDEYDGRPVRQTWRPREAQAPLQKLVEQRVARENARDRADAVDRGWTDSRRRCRRRRVAHSPE